MTKRVSTKKKTRAEKERERQPREMANINNKKNNQDILLAFVCLFICLLLLLFGIRQLPHYIKMYNASVSGATAAMAAVWNPVLNNR